MGQGYTRNDVTNNIANGNVITAADLDGEFDALVAAFVNTTGHTHDGTVAEGGVITVIGPVQDYVGDGAALYPKLASVYTLGKAGLTWLDVLTDNLTLGGTAITSTAAELNILDGVTSTAAELNFVAGVTSNIQTQLDNKVDSYLNKSTTYTASAGERVTADVSGAAWTLTLPATPTAGDMVIAAVIVGDPTVNLLTVDGNGTNIAGAATFGFDQASTNVTFIYNGTEWKVTI